MREAIVALVHPSIHLCTHKNLPYPTFPSKQVPLSLSLPLLKGANDKSKIETDPPVRRNSCLDTCGGGGLDPFTILLDALPIPECSPVYKYISCCPFPSFRKRRINHPDPQKSGRLALFAPQPQKLKHVGGRSHKTSQKFGFFGPPSPFSVLHSRNLSVPSSTHSARTLYLNVACEEGRYGECRGGLVSACTPTTHSATNGCGMLHIQEEKQSSGPAKFEWDLICSVLW